MKLFSVIIPTCNRNDSLTLCLDRLQPGEQSLEAHHYEVIVSDDGKDNEAKALIEQQYPWAQWIAGPKKGPAANRNNGASLAQGEWLVFTDDDCLPDAHWLNEYEKAISAYPECKAFEGAILPDDWALLKKDMAECPVNTTGGCFWSANIMVEKKMFAVIGGFDEAFRIAAQEDQDLQIRLSATTVIQFIREAVVIHPVRLANFSKAIRSVGVSTRNYLYYAGKHLTSLGYSNQKQVAWNKGVITQANAFKQHLRKGHWKKALLSLYNLMVYVPIYLKA